MSNTIDRGKARDILREYLPEYLEENGFSLRKGNPCPCCNGGQHKRNVFHYNKKTNKVKCFACGFSGDIFALVCAQYGLGDCKTNFPEVLEKTAELLGFQLSKDHTKLIPGKSRKRPVKHVATARRVIDNEPEPDYLDYIFEAAKKNDYKYLESRGISKKVQKRFLIGLDESWINPKTVENWKADGKDPSKIVKSPRCIIPNSRYSYLARDTRGNLTEKQKNYSKQFVGSKRLFNYKALNRSEAIFVVEGEIDALSVVEAGFDAVGLCGVTNIDKIVNAMEKGCFCKSLVLMLDNDAAGIENTAKLASKLDEIGVPYVNYLDYDVQAAHDPNDWLCENRANFVSALGNLQKLALAKYKRKNSLERKIELAAEVSRVGESVKSFSRMERMEEVRI